MEFGYEGDTRLIASKETHAAKSLHHPRRPSAVKFKVNGICINRCVFCPFHSDRRRLEVSDLSSFFDKAGDRRFSEIVINGGEPTLHPHFAEICAFLKARFKGQALLTLGTNLISLTWKRGRYPALLARILETYDKLEVGCDDEHKNIGALESLAPVFAEAGVDLKINTLPAYCSGQTRKRIEAVGKKFGFAIRRSDVHHFCHSAPAIRHVTARCADRTSVLLFNCNGDGFFCYRQELQQPSFNLHTVTPEDLRYFIDKYDPEPYRFCSHCSAYVAEGPLETFRRKLSRMSRAMREACSLRGVQPAPR